MQVQKILFSAVPGSSPLPALHWLVSRHSEAQGTSVSSIHTVCWLRNEQLFLRLTWILLQYLHTSQTEFNLPFTPHTANKSDVLFTKCVFFALYVPIWHATLLQLTYRLHSKQCWSVTDPIKSQQTTMASAVGLLNTFYLSIYFFGFSV